MVTGILYLVSPFDFIPEMVFGLIGYLDDLVIVIFVLIAVGQGFRQVL